VAGKPAVLRKALERAQAKGWIKRLSGNGFGGSFELAFPY